MKPNALLSYLLKMLIYSENGKYKLKYPSCFLCTYDELQFCLTDDLFIKITGFYLNIKLIHVFKTSIIFFINNIKV